MDNPAVTHVEISQPQTPARSHGLMDLLMLVATSCWAANIVVGKEALQSFSTLALAQLRVFGAALLFGLLFLAWRKRPALRLTRRQWLYMTAVAMCGVTFNQLFFIAGIGRTSVAHSGLIVAFGPVMVLVLSCSLRLEALTISKFVGMLVSFTGVAVLTVGRAGQGSGANWLGDLILLTGSAVFAGYTILVKGIADRYDALTLNALTFALGTLLMMFLGARAVFQVRWASLPGPAYWSLAYMVVLGSVVPYLIFAFALTELTAARVAAFSYLQPVLATGLGIWLLRERLTVRVVVGGPLILLGVYLTERERDEPKVAIEHRGPGI